uniref:small monomeric GTPase n=1 Tax=Sinocyclocheilus grahami TaxID=75366 RepID=A0A672SCX3_SINGR
MKTLEIDGIKVRIQMWDTAGQERYQTITKQYYRRAQGIFLVYDITSERSFQHIMKWASDVDEVKLWSLKHICLAVTKYNPLLINISSFKFHHKCLYQPQHYRGTMLSV